MVRTICPTTQVMYLLSFLDGLRHAEAVLLRGESRLRKPTGGLRHAVGSLWRTECGG